MKEEKTQIADGVASVLNAELCIDDSYTDFLAKLKAGHVYVGASFARWGSEFIIKEVKIEKSTDSSLWVDGQRYSRKTGKVYGDGFSEIPRIATQHQIDVFETKKLLSKITQFLHKKTLNYEQRAEFYRIINNA